MNHYDTYSKIELTTTGWSKKYKKIKQWAVTEKIHGANFAFIYENNSIQYGKRNGIIESTDSFFNYQQILPDTLPKIQLMIDRIQHDAHQNHMTYQKIIIYGELFGGIYPEYPLRTIPIQKGVYYSPDIHFYAFDIYVVENTPTTNTANTNLSIASSCIGIGKYLDFEQSIDYFQQVDLLYAEPLGIFPSYDKASQYPLGFSTTIPTKLHLPPIPSSASCNENRAEGIVIRSMTERYIVKIKIVEFAEALYYDNSIDSQDKQSIIPYLITENRLNNAISKIGLLDDYRYQIYEMICIDILQELNIIDVPERKKLRQFIMDETIQKFG